MIDARIKGCGIISQITYLRFVRSKTATGAPDVIIPYLFGCLAK